MQIFKTIFLLCLTFGLQAQCVECPGGSTIITGSTNINEQNMAIDYCVTGTWTGSISNIADNSTLTICPTAEWQMNADLTISKNIDITNYGAITEGVPGIKIFIMGQTNLINEGTITITDFENQDAEFINNGDLTAENIYLHGIATNNGTITSTADCGGTATQNCGFYIGNKSTDFVNFGMITAIDASLLDGVIGGSGQFDISGTLSISNNGGPTDNIFNVNNLVLQSGQTYNSGMFNISGELDCNGANINTAELCFTATGSQSSNCSNNSDPIIMCATLPTTFIDFGVQTINKYTVFNWETTNEINLSHYEIETSIDGINFEYLLDVDARNIGIYQAKAETDRRVLTYFRLSSIDYDGTKNVFDKIIKLDQEVFNDFKVSPNPVHKNGTLKITHAHSQDVLVTIFDINGSNVFSRYFAKENDIIFDLESLDKNGLYIVKLSTPTETITKEIIVF